MGRRRARELAFRALFGAARGDEPLLDAWADLRADLTEQTPGEAEEVYGEPLGADGLAFAERLVRAFAENQSELDGRLAGVLEGWTFAQMSQTDLAVLRLALTEMTYEDLPPEVTFEVAVRIAKRYGGEESGRFVNGVLARLYRDRQKSGGQTRAITQDPEVQNVEDLTAVDPDLRREDVSAPDVPNAAARPGSETLDIKPDIKTSDLKDPAPKDTAARSEPQTDARDPDVVQG